jgi:hypothetical protein
MHVSDKEAPDDSRLSSTTVLYSCNPVPLSWIWICGVARVDKTVAQ